MYYHVWLKAIFVEMKTKFNLETERTLKVTFGIKCVFWSWLVSSDICKAQISTNCQAVTFFFCGVLLGSHCIHNHSQVPYRGVKGKPAEEPHEREGGV